LFTRLGTEENRDDYIDRALIEAAAASFHLNRLATLVISLASKTISASSTSQSVVTKTRTNISIVRESFS
jgi:hypothetical protein